MDVSRKKMISDSLFLLVGNLLLRLKGLIFLPIIISYVGMENYGAFVQIMVNVGMVGPFCTLELGMGFYRYTSKYNGTEAEKLSRDYWTILTAVFVLSLSGALVVYLLSPVISKYILAGTSLNALRLSSLLVVSSGLNYVNVKYIQSRKKFRLSSIYSIVHELMPHLGFLIGIVLRSSILFGLLLYSTIQVILTLFLNIYITKDLHLLAPSNRILKQFLKYSWALFLSGFTGGLLSKVDRYFIGYFLGPATIGIYNIVYSVCSLLQIFDVPFNKYFAIYLPRVWDEGKQDRVVNQLKEGLLYYLIISVGSLVFITFLLKPALNMILSKDFPEIPNFEWLVLITGLGILGFGITFFFYHLIRYKSENHLILISQLVAAILNIGLNYFFVKKYGIIGAGVTTFISYLVAGIICSRFVHLGLDLSFKMKVLKIALSALAIGFLFRLRIVSNILDLSLNIALGLVIYMLCIFAMHVVRFQDIRKIFT